MIKSGAILKDKLDITELAEWILDSFYSSWTEMIESWEDGKGKLKQAGFIKALKYMKEIEAVKEKYKNLRDKSLKLMENK